MSVAPVPREEGTQIRGPRFQTQMRRGSTSERTVGPAKDSEVRNGGGGVSG